MNISFEQKELKAKKSKPQYKVELNEGGEEESVKVRNSAFTTSILKRYYNQQIHSIFYFRYEEGNQ